MLDYKESWLLKNWCFWTVVLEKTLESPLDCKEIQLANPKGNQFWIITGSTNGDAEAPILFHLMGRTDIGKDSDAEKDWRQEEKGMTEDEMVGWCHQLDGHEFEQALGFGDGHGVTELNWVAWEWLQCGQGPEIYFLNNFIYLGCAGSSLLQAFL